MPIALFVSISQMKHTGYYENPRITIPSSDPFQDNIYDQSKLLTNVSTNIEPVNKSAGWFFVYSLSSIDKVFD